MLVLLYLFVTCWFVEHLNTVLITPFIWDIYEPYTREAAFGVVRFASLLVSVPRKTWQLFPELYVMKCRKKWKLSSTLLTRIFFTLNYARERLVSHPLYKHTIVKPVLNGIFLQRKGFQYLVVSFHAGFTVFHDLFRHVKKGQTQSPVSWCQTDLGKTRSFFYFLIHKGECIPVYAVKT